MIARLFFIIVPAIILGGLLSIIHPAVGLVIATCVAGIGIEATAPRYERGEQEPPPWPLMRRIKHYEPTPHGWGLAWYEDYKNVSVVMPVPLNAVAAAVRAAITWLRFELPDALTGLLLRWEARRNVQLAMLLTLDRKEVTYPELAALEWLREQNPGRFREPGDMEAVIRALLREVTQGQVAHARAEMLEDRLRGLLSVRTANTSLPTESVVVVLEYAKEVSQGTRGDIHYLCSNMLKRLRGEG